MDRRTFVERFLKPESNYEWGVLIAIIVVVIGVLIFLYFAYTKWRFM